MRTKTTQRQRFASSYPHAHVEQDRNGLVDGNVHCRVCNRAIVRCVCVERGDGDVNPYCPSCRGTGWVLAQHQRNTK